MKIKFKDETLLEIVESYDEENDHTETKDETFEAGEIHDVDLCDDRGDTINIQFGDGSMCYGLPKDAIEFVGNNGHITYRELERLIGEMSDEQKDSDVTVFDNQSEFFAISSLNFAEQDVLDEGHPFLAVL